MAMNFEQARHNMIEQQIRPWDVLDSRVLDVLGRMHREDFVPTAYRKLAFAELNLPLGHDEVMMTPGVEGRLLQALAIEPGERVLEIGTGSGFITACLAALGGRVTSVEIHEELLEQAFKRLDALTYENIQLDHADVMTDWEPEQPYDAIAVTGSVPQAEERFQSWLKPGGRLFVIVGESPAMTACLITRVDDRQWSRESLFETDLPALVNAVKKETFEF